MRTLAKRDRRTSLRDGELSAARVWGKHAEAVPAWLATASADGRAVQPARVGLLQRSRSSLCGWVEMGARALLCLALAQGCWSFQVLPVQALRASAPGQRSLTLRPCARPRRAGAQARGAQMLWAEQGSSAGGRDEPARSQASNDGAPPLPRAGLLDALRESHKLQATAHQQAAGLLDALGVEGAANNNLLDQIMHTTKADKRAVGEVEQLLRVVNALTTCPSEGGCPWTAEQDAMGIIEHAKGELDEVREEIILGDDAEHKALESELGDLLFNAILLIKLCERDGLGGATLEGAAQSAQAKLRRRAPFIFGEGERPKTPEEANAIWKAAKKQEKAVAALEGPPRFIEGLGIYAGDEEDDGWAMSDHPVDKKSGA